MSTCVQVFFYSVFPMATKDTLKKFYKSVATEISFRWLGKAVSQVIDATIYIKVRTDAQIAFEQTETRCFVLVSTTFVMVQ